MRSVEPPELFVALVGPVGTELGGVTKLLRAEFAAYQYKTVEIRLSELLRTGKARKQLEQIDRQGVEDARIRAYQKAGDDLRKSSKEGAALAYFAIQFLYTQRKTKPVEEGTGRVLVFNSLKHPREIEQLRRIYRDSLLVVSVYQKRSARISRLIQKIQRTRGSVRDDDVAIANELLEDDEHTPDPKKLSQNVRDTFPLADVFVAVDKGNESLREQIARAIRLWFGSPFESPTRLEQAMFFAMAAAKRSTDLSRQVGAAIVKENGSVLAIGCNEVPRPGGGGYWDGDPRDYRDFRWGVDENQRTKRRIVQELARRLIKAGFIKSTDGPEKLVGQWLDGQDAALKGTRVASLIEFGRVVHAEMNAIMDAARRGVSTQDTTLVCTTFPCHMCARHLLAAGVRQVLYIEPYPKSMTKDLYGNAVSIDGEPADPDALDFSAFVGVAPIRYLAFFDAPKRKDDRGYPKTWSPDVAIPQVSTPYTYQENEARALKWVADHAETIGVSAPRNSET